MIGMKPRVRQGTWIRKIFPCIPVFLILILVRGAFSADNSACLSCHQDENLSIQDARGRKVSLFVSEAEYKNSVHGKLSCSSCHIRIKDDTHSEGGKKAANKGVNCGACHRNAEKEYDESLHAKAAQKGTERAAYCHDCHGSHNVLPKKNPNSMVYSSNISKTCNRCHSNTEFIKEHALGGGPSPGELFETSVHEARGMLPCTNCQGSHHLGSLIDRNHRFFGPMFLRPAGNVTRR